ncbi:NrfD/PsrC family molybdoenzyme membrane anchor subunit [uncultured Fibrobacter sp.]|uniref:NrfD/PsrC family molybdoenzyme membrane anchor subunit n=1 Tax=uncultured Fibrobacter sp. TaxID=261512 RepID=UPI002618C7E1|nr:NrfD/PsrC family molybdoenzyme membrane anchor subunit [uncultured Fibrobacter sp.]
MFKYLMLAGLALFLPGLYALGYSVYQGPSAWMVDSQTFWGTPISLFVFWIGLAHAGTLLSAIFLALDIKLDRRTALIAELSTLVSLVFAGIFPLMHLGVIDNFYMVAPFLDARGNFANVRSPLVWDFCCIAVYAVLSLLFFVTHLYTKRAPKLDIIRKPMAWLLFPLVLWVHTIVSLDFATTFVPEWRGAFFPVYFIAGAILSGLALVNLLLCAEGYRVRLLERLQLICSWFLCAIWIWDFLLKDSFCTSAFIFAGVLPQLRMVSVVRESKLGRIALSTSVLVGLFLERFFLVAPERGVSGIAGFGCVDLGLVAFSVGGFMLLYFALRRYLNDSMEGMGAYFGEVDGSDMAKLEEDAENKAHGVPKSKKGFYIHPWSSDEYRMLRFPLFVGIMSSVIFAFWAWAQLPFENVGLSLANLIPLLYPIVALVTVLALYIRLFLVDKIFVPNAREKLFGMSGLVVFAFCAGAFYAGGVSIKSSETVESRPISHENPLKKYIREMSRDVSDSSDVDAQRTLPHASLLWKSRCATCHGADGLLNEKFIREFYPVPQNVDLLRIDSLGIDSLVKVVLYGRNNMNPYGDRLTPAEARGLVLYMRQLALEKASENIAAEGGR